MTKYKYSRKQWLKKWHALPDNTPLDEILLDLLATKPEKEWVCEVCFKPFDAYLKNNILEEYICPICSKHTPSPLEEIEEIYMKDGVIKIKTVVMKINEIIRTVNKLTKK